MLKPLKPRKVDTWESDSDSDESDDEHDLQNLMVYIGLVKGWGVAVGEQYGLIAELRDAVVRPRYVSQTDRRCAVWAGDRTGDPLAVYVFVSGFTLSRYTFTMYLLCVHTS